MDTRLHGHALVLARAAWVALVALTLGLFIASIPAHLHQLRTVSDAPPMWLQISPAQGRALFDLGRSVQFYATYMLALQSLFRFITGQNQSDIVTAVSTLAIAAAFQPVRRRLQILIDKSLFRRRYEAEEALAVFGLAVRDDVQTDLNRLTNDLVAVVDKTMRPAHISLWLPPSIHGKQDAAHNE